jgi:uncharacterized Zn finger protein
MLIKHCPTISLSLCKHVVACSLKRIVEQNEVRLKKLRDLERDDLSLLDSNEVLERFQQKQRLQRHGSQTTMNDDTWLRS